MTKIDRSHISNFMHRLGLVTAAAFFVLGVFILCTEQLNNMEKTYRVIFASLFFAIGCYRIVNWYLKNKSRQYNEFIDTDEN
jgi:hypothetical protein